MNKAEQAAAELCEQGLFSRHDIAEATAIINEHFPTAPEAGVVAIDAIEEVLANPRTADPDTYLVARAQLSSLKSAALSAAAVPRGDGEVLCQCRTFNVGSNRAYLDCCEFLHTTAVCPEAPFTEQAAVPAAPQQECTHGGYKSLCPECSPLS